MLKKALKIAVILVLAAAAAILSVKLFPALLSLRDEASREAFRSIIDSFAPLGILLMLLIQTVQVIVAVIPGEPVEILLGMMYGTVGGLALSLLGTVLGQTAVFLLIKRYGISFASRFVDVGKFTELKFLRDTEKRDGLIFLLFFIPGTPKDLLTYFAPFTGIGLLRFTLLSTFARIPSVVTSTLAGASLTEGDFMKTALIFAVTGVLGLAGILINRRFKDTRGKNRKRSSNPQKERNI